jgi:hypothetical protein
MAAWSDFSDFILPLNLEITPLKIA